MIKINLLRESESKPTRIFSPDKSQVGLYLFALMFLAIVGMIWWYSHLSSLRSEYTGEADQLRQESMRLAVVKGQLERYEQQKKLLDERIAVIEKLKNNQKGPVLLMNALIDSVPAEPRLWLDSVVQKEKTITIKGQASDAAAVASFIKKLGENKPFTQVDLLEYVDENNIIKFQLSCQIGG
jgi:Tfp pilus assembly protein PilN